MARAGLLAKVISELPAQNWYFLSGKLGNIVESSFLEINGTWTRGASNSIIWNGTDPSFTASGSVSPASLEIGEATGPGATSLTDRLCDIPHTAVPLENGDTIVYTSIEISFTTDDVVS
jgi:hypothetical protein